MKRFLAVGVAAATLLGGACGASGDDDSKAKAVASGKTTKRLTVVANFYPIYEALREIGGDAVEVKNLTPAGTEPHDLELTPKQVDSLLDADLVAYVGKGFQPAVEETVKKRDGASVEVLEGLELKTESGHAEEHEEHEEHQEDGEHEEGEEHEEAAEDGEHEEAAKDEEHEEHGELEGGIDPHVWLDPTLMVQITETLEGALAKAEPDLAEDFARNAKVYRGELEDLDRQYAFGLRDCERRELVTSHAAFGYLARRYRLEQHGISGLSPEAEPDPQRLSELVDEVKRSGTTTVFSESLASPRIAQTLAKEAGVGTAVLNPLEGLTEEEADAGETYISVMQNNLAELKKALGCTN